MRRLGAKASYMLEVFAGVKIRKKEGLSGLHKESKVSNSYVPTFTMRCSIAVKTVQVNYV